MRLHWLIMLTLLLSPARPVMAEADLFGLPDPTRPAGVGDIEASRTRGLTEIHIAPRGRFAVVDGKTVRVGDAVDGGVVTDIRPDEVIVKRGDRVSTLRLTPQLKKDPHPGTTGR